MPGEEKAVKIDNFDDILNHVGGWNRYQATLLVISFPFAFIMGYVYFTPVLMLYTPEHRCANASQAVGQCQMYSEEGELVDCQGGNSIDFFWPQKWAKKRPGKRHKSQICYQHIYELFHSKEFQ